MVRVIPTLTIGARTRKGILLGARIGPSNPVRKYRLRLARKRKCRHNPSPKVHIARRRNRTTAFLTGVHGRIPFSRGFLRCHHYQFLIRTGSRIWFRSEREMLTGGWCTNMSENILESFNRLIWHDSKLRSLRILRNNDDLDEVLLDVELRGMSGQELTSMTV